MITKRSILVLILSIFSALEVMADPLIHEIFPKKIHVIDNLKYGDMATTDGPSGGSPISPNFEGYRGMVFYMGNRHLARVDYSSLSVVDEPGSYTDEYSGGENKYHNENFSISFGGPHVSLLRNRDIYKWLVIHFQKDMDYIAMVEDLIIHRSRKTKDYLIVQVYPDNTWKIYMDGEALAFAAQYGKGLSVRDKTIYFLDGPLFTGTDTIDDDGNQYSSVLVYIQGRLGLEIQLPEDPPYSYTMFDPEGNFWGVGFTRDLVGNPVLYYAGRDWGYREPAREAVTTGNNLRLRLRSNTKAFILETLPEGSPLTVLKTGPEETIGGNRAPWYKVKTKDGIVGWAWGGFLKIAE